MSPQRPQKWPARIVMLAFLFLWLDVMSVYQSQLTVKGLKDSQEDRPITSLEDLVGKRVMTIQPYRDILWNEAGLRAMVQAGA